jgi:Holliday junction resolvasome RuvABC endonuclease subunit
MQKRILGLDISSSTIGLSIINWDGYQENLIHTEYYKPKKEKDQNFIITLKETREFIMNFVKTWQPTEVVVEDFLLAMINRSTAQTIVKLAIVNRTCCLAVMDSFGKPPTLFHISTIRASILVRLRELNLTQPKQKAPKKEELPDAIEKILRIKFPYYYNKKKNIREESLDIADSIAVGLCYIEKYLKPQNIKIKKKRKNKNEPKNTTSLPNTGNTTGIKRRRSKKTI